MRKPLRYRYLREYDGGSRTVYEKTTFYDVKGPPTSVPAGNLRPRWHRGCCLNARAVLPGLGSLGPAAFRDGPGSADVRAAERFEPRDHRPDEVVWCRGSRREAGHEGTRWWQPSRRGHLRFRAHRTVTNLVRRHQTVGFGDVEGRPRGGTDARKVRGVAAVVPADHDHQIDRALL